jgi:hypothetical protein
MTMQHDPCLDHWHPGPRACAIKPHPTAEYAWVVEVWVEVEGGSRRCIEIHGLDRPFTADEANQVASRLLDPPTDEVVP